MWAIADLAWDRVVMVNLVSFSLLDYVELEGRKLLLFVEISLIFTINVWKSAYLVTFESDQRWG